MRAPGNMPDRPRPIKRKYVMKQRMDLNLKSPQALNWDQLFLFFCNFNLQKGYFFEKSAFRIRPSHLYKNKSFFNTNKWHSTSKCWGFCIWYNSAPSLIYTSIRASGYNFFQKCAFCLNVRSGTPPPHTHISTEGIWGRNT